MEQVIRGGGGGVSGYSAEDLAIASFASGIEVFVEFLEVLLGLCDRLQCKFH